MKKHLSKKEVEEIVEKIKELGYKRVPEKHEALVHRFDSSDGVIKIYRKMSREDDYSIVITGSSDFEGKMQNYLFGEETQVEADPGFDMVIGIDESGVSASENFIASAVSYRVFDLVDSKKIRKESLQDYFSDILMNSEFLATFKLHIGLLEHIRSKGYKVGDIVYAIGEAILMLFEKLGMKVKVVIDGDKPAKAPFNPKIEYLGRGGELKDRNVAAAGVVSTYLRRIVNRDPPSQPP